MRQGLGSSYLGVKEGRGLRIPCEAGLSNMAVHGWKHTAPCEHRVCVLLGGNEGGSVSD